MCRCAYPQEILILFFALSYTLFELRNLAKMNHTTETVCQCNSSETAQHYFVIYTGNADLILLMSNLYPPLNFGQNYFVQLR